MLGQFEQHCTFCQRRASSAFLLASMVTVKAAPRRQVQATRPPATMRLPGFKQRESYTKSRRLCICAFYIAPLLYLRYWM